MDEATLLSEFSWNLENECSGSAVPFPYSLDALEAFPALDGNPAAGPHELDSIKKTQQDHSARLDHLEHMLAKLTKQHKECRRRALSAENSTRGLRGWASELKMALEDIVHDLREETEELVKKRVDEHLKNR